MDFERHGVPPVPPVPTGRVLDLVAASDLVMQPGYLMRITAKTPFNSASAYLDPVIWNSRAFHNALPLLFAQLAVTAGVPHPDAADWTSEIVSNLADDAARAGHLPPPATLAPQSRTVFEPLDVKIGQWVRLEGTTPDGRSAASNIHPTLWNLGQEEHYTESRRAVLWLLGIDPNAPEQIDAAAAVAWTATVVEADPEAPPPARTTSQDPDTPQLDRTAMYDTRPMFAGAPAAFDNMAGEGARR